MTRKKKSDQNKPYAYMGLEEERFLYDYLDKYYKDANMDFEHKSLQVDVILPDDSFLFTPDATEEAKFLFRSWITYNRCINAMPVNSPNLAEHYCGRAVNLNALNEFEDVITDCDRGLSVKLAGQSVKARLFDFKTKAIMKLRRCLSDKERQLVREQIDSISLSADGKRMLENQLNEIMDSLPRKKVLSDSVDWKESLRMDAQDDNPSLSSCIELITDSEGNRYFVAKTDIQPGTLLAIEEKLPSSVSINPDVADWYCSHCQKMSYTYEPCDKCTQYQYCSSKCRKDDWDKYHKWECGTFPSNYTYDYKVFWRFFFELVEKAGGIDNFVQYYGADDTWIKGLPVSEEKFERSSNIKFRYNYEEPDLQFACEAAYCLATHTNYFGKKYKEMCIVKLLKSKEIVSYAAAILRSFYLYAANSITFQVYTKSPALKSTQAFAVYPYCRYFNHSCAPNAEFFTAKDQEMVVFAKVPIKKGTEITISHIQATYLNMHKDDRARNLANLELYDCSCIACKKNWNMPKLKALKDILQKKPEEYQKIVDKYREALCLADKKFVMSVETIMSTLSEMYELGNGITNEYMTLYGNVHRKYTVLIGGLGLCNY